MMPLSKCAIKVLKKRGIDSEVNKINVIVETVKYQFTATKNLIQKIIAEGNYPYIKKFLDETDGMKYIFKNTFSCYGIVDSNNIVLRKYNNTFHFFYFGKYKEADPIDIIKTENLRNEMKGLEDVFFSLVNQLIKECSDNG